MIERLKECFTEDFTNWLFKSNHPKLGSSYDGEDKLLHLMNIDELESESLTEILDILLREPKADYFWYTYKEHGGGLTYALPHHDVVPGDALRVDKEKIKSLLRDIKINTILN